jgi:hypothetical protein
VELSLGVQCPNTDYSKLFPNSSYTPTSNAIDTSLRAVAKDAHPSVAKVLEEVALQLPAVLAELGLSDQNVRRDSPDISARKVPNPNGYGFGRDKMSASGPVNSNSHKRSLELDAAEAVHDPHGSNLEPHTALKHRHHSRGVSASLKKSKSKKCLMTAWVDLVAVEERGVNWAALDRFANKAWQYNNPPWVFSKPPVA